MADIITEKGSAKPCTTKRPIINAPQPLKGIRILLLADVESAMYASSSRDIFNLSNSGLYKAPTVSTEMLDSTKISIPVSHAITATLRRDCSSPASAWRLNHC